MAGRTGDAVLHLAPPALQAGPYVVELLLAHVVRRGVGRALHGGSALGEGLVDRGPLAVGG